MWLEEGLGVLDRQRNGARYVKLEMAREGAGIGVGKLEAPVEMDGDRNKASAHGQGGKCSTAEGTANSRHTTPG